MISDPPEAEPFAAQIEEHLARLDKPRFRIRIDEAPASPGPAIFSAAAKLFRRKPWDLFPSDQDVVLFSVPALGVHEAVLSVIGQDGVNPGILLFHAVRDFETYVAVALNPEGAFSSSGDDIEKDKLPPHLALTFDGAKHTDRDLRAIVKARRWELAGEDAYPNIMAVDAGMRVRVAQAWEQLLLEAAALGLCLFLEEESAVRRAYRTDSFHEAEIVVTSSYGELTVILGGPVGAPDDDDEGEEDGHGGAGDGDRTADPPSPEEAAAVDDPTEALIEAFAASDEADPFFDVGAIGAFLLHARHLHQAAPSAITPAHVETILQQAYVRDVPVPPHLAVEIVAIVNAFFAWLDKEGGGDAPHAAANAALLDEAFMRRLWTALGTPSLWSTEKRNLMQGVPIRPLPARSKAVGPVSQAEKNKRKAARKRR